MIPLAPGDRTVPWLDRCPPDWVLKPIKYLCGVNKRVLTEDTDPEYEFRYIDIGSVDSDGRWSPSPPMRFAEAPSRARRMVVDGDVLISTVRTYLRAITHVQEANGALVCSTGFAVLSPGQRIVPNFLAYWARSAHFVDEIVARSLGVSYPAINASDIGNLPVPELPVAQQRAIAAFLDRETARIDSLTAKKRRQIDLLQEKRAALISHAVTKGLDANTPMKDSAVDWLGEIPSHWEVKRVKHLGMIRYGLGEPPEYVDDGLPFIRATDIKRGKVDLDAVRRVRREDVAWSRRPMLELGEVLVVRSGAYTGDSALVTENVAGCIAGYDMVLTVTKAHPPFVAWVLLSKYMLEGQIFMERMRAAQPHLNAEELGEFVILMPPVEEQRQIADVLALETGKLDAMSDKIDDSIELLREYRTALSSAAVTGKIVAPMEVA